MDKTDYSLVTLTHFTSKFLKEIINEPKTYTAKTIQLAKRVLNARGK